MLGGRRRPRSVELGDRARGGSAHEAMIRVVTVKIDPRYVPGRVDDVRECSLIQSGACIRGVKFGYGARAPARTNPWATLGAVR